MSNLTKNAIKNPFKNKYLEREKIPTHIIKRNCQRFYIRKKEAGRSCLPCDLKSARKTFNKGYILLYIPEHPYSHCGYVYEHRFLIELEIGRFLTPQEHCHHLDNNRANNLLTNLMAFITNSAHRRFEKGNKVKPKEIIFDGGFL